VSGVTLIDTHCHLDAAEFDADRADVASAAAGAGVAAIVVPAVERANFGAVASVCREFPGCVPAYGIHPMYVGRAVDADLDALRATLAREPAVAVGEIGLDRFVEPRDDARQEFFFVEQLRIARDFGLPVLLHVRRAIDPILRQLRRIGVAGGIAHAFNGSRQQADEFIKLGFVLGFGGAMTYPRAARIRELAATLPEDALVLETDAPDMAPAWRIGAGNAPAELPRIAAELAALRGVAVDNVAAFTGRNARRVLPRLAG
jgi:TatD DNase family protein